MSPETKLFGRLTLGATRTSLGSATLNVLLIRARSEIEKLKHRADMVIQLEFSPTKLPDSTTFNREALLEQEFSSQLITDPNANSGFPDITIARLGEAMESPEYAAYNTICHPDKRLGLTIRDVERIKLAYANKFPDCVDHFPLWVES